MVERESRSVKQMNATVPHNGGRAFPAVIRNVSNGGCRLSSGEALMLVTSFRSKCRGWHNHGSHVDGPGFDAGATLVLSSENSQPHCARAIAAKPSRRVGINRAINHCS